MFTNVPPTPYDLRFRLFGFPVRIHPFFWLVTALMGDSALRIGAVYLLLWIAVVFVSILVHELGHAFAIRFFGSPCEVLLYAMGGLAIPTYDMAPGWRRMAISLAGPAAGFTLGGIVYLTDRSMHWSERSLFLEIAYDFLLWVNLFWNVVNLLPIWPLDGGQACRDALHLMGVKSYEVMTHRISMLVAGGLAALSIALFFNQVPPQIAEAIPYRPGLFMTLLFVVFAYENYQLHQIASGRANPPTW